MPQDELDSMIQVAVEQAKAPPKGHLAKPFKMDDGSWLHILDSGLYQIKKNRTKTAKPNRAKYSFQML